MLARTLVAITALTMAAGAAAEVVTDGTVGPGRRLAGPDCAIGADLGSRAGGNLFHSFGASRSPAARARRSAVRPASPT
jgi:hypothetical protein